MPTAKGWRLGLGSLVVGAGGRVLGLEELYVVAAAAALLLAASVAWVRLRPVRIEARRHLAPARVPAGQWTTASLTLAPRGRQATPALCLDDGAAGRFVLPALRGPVQVSYRLDASRRGLIPAGPLRAGVTDPFGLAARTVEVLAPSTLIVHPAVDEIALAPEGTGRSAPSRPAPARIPGGDFHGLRPYETGDDLRLVHWPTSARLDDLVVRQDELPHLRRTVVALDLRASVHDGVTQELAVSAAAGVFAAASAGEGVVRLVTTGGIDSGWAGGDAHQEEVFDLLAAAHADASPGLREMASLLANDEEATLVLVTAAGAQGLSVLGPAVADAMGSVAVVVGVTRPGSLGLAFDTVVPVGRAGGFRQAWERAWGVETAPSPGATRR